MQKFNLVSTMLVCLWLLAGCGAVKGYKALEQGDNAQAYLIFAEQLMDSPRDAEALAGQGISTFRMGFKQDGLNDLRAAHALDPDNHKVILYLAEAEAETGDLIAAGNLLKTYTVRAKPIVQQGMRKAGQALLILGYVDEARERMVNAAMGVYPDPDPNLMLWTYYRDTSREPGSMTPCRKGATARIIEAINASNTPSRAVSWERLEGYSLALGLDEGQDMFQALDMARLMGSGRYVWGELGTGSPVNGSFSVDSAKANWDMLTAYVSVTDMIQESFPDFFNEIEEIEKQIRDLDRQYHDKISEATEPIRKELDELKVQEKNLSEKYSELEKKHSLDKEAIKKEFTRAFEAGEDLGAAVREANQALKELENRIRESAREREKQNQQLEDNRKALLEDKLLQADRKTYYDNKDLLDKKKELREKRAEMLKQLALMAEIFQGMRQNMGAWLAQVVVELEPAAKHDELEELSWKDFLEYSVQLEEAAQLSDTVDRDDISNWLPVYHEDLEAYQALPPCQR